MIIKTRIFELCNGNYRNFDTLCRVVPRDHRNVGIVDEQQRVVLFAKIAQTFTRVTPRTRRFFLVPTVTLTKLLDDNGVTSIDFLSMDIEGSEPAALAGFDIERFAPELVCIEMIPNPENRKKITEYFEAHGYQRIQRYIEHDAEDILYLIRGIRDSPAGIY